MSLITQVRHAVGLWSRGVSVAVTLGLGLALAIAMGWVPGMILASLIRADGVWLPILTTVLIAPVSVAAGAGTLQAVLKGSKGG